MELWFDAAMKKDLRSVLVGLMTLVLAVGLAPRAEASVPPTTTTVVTSVNPSVFGESVTLSAIVSESAAAGTVSFSDGGTVLGTATVVSGFASLSTSGLAVGDHSVSATFQPTDGSAYSSSTGSVTQSVYAASTTATLSATPNPVTFGNTVTMTASVAVVAPGSGTPSGTVDFYSGATLLGSGAVNVAGTATLSTSSLPAGTSNLVAVYSPSGSSFNGATSSSVSLTVDKATPSVTLTSSLNPSVYGDNVTLTASLTGVGGVLPTGIVLFKNGGTTVGATSVDGSGNSSLTTSSLTRPPTRSRLSTAVTAPTCQQRPVRCRKSSTAPQQPRPSPAAPVQRGTAHR